MSRRPPIALLAVFLLLVVAFAWLGAELLGAGAGSEGLASGLGAESAAVPAPGGAELIGLGQARDSGAPERDAVTLPVAEEGPGRKRSGWRVPTASVWIEGRVELPDGTPLDEELWVVATGSPFSTAPDARRKTYAEVDREGRFRAAFARDTRVGRLDVEARYLYLEEPLTLRFKKLPEEEIVLAPKVGGRVLARLLAPAARAMEQGVFEGVEVSAARFRGFSMGGEEGRALEESLFEIGGLRPGQVYVVEASSPRFADTRESDVEIESGGTTRVELAFTPGAAVSGQVLDHRGEPVEEAKVHAMTVEQARRRNPVFNEEHTNTLTDREGRFSLQGVEPGELALVTEAEGFLEHIHELGDHADGQRTNAVVVRLDRGELLAGIVRWPDGALAEGATVRVTQRWGRGGFVLERDKGTVTVGADGRFQFAALTEEPCSITASSPPPDATPEQLAAEKKLLGEKLIYWRAHRKELEPGQVNLILELRPGSVLAGTVSDDQGEPVERFRVTASPASNSMFSSSSIKPVRGRFKDDRGRFELEGLQPGDWKVRVTAVGHGNPDPQQVTVPHDGLLRFVAPRSGTLSGTVLSPGGDPLGGARVKISHGTRNESIECEQDGTFAVTKLIPGAVELRAQAQGFGQGEPVHLELPAGGERKDLRIFVAPPATIVGELHPGLADVADREVSLRGPETYTRTRPGSDGSFRFEGLSSGTFTLKLEQPGGGTRRGVRRGRQEDWLLEYANRVEVEVEVDAGQTVHVVLGEPPEDALRVHGLVTRAGEPAAGEVLAWFQAGDRDEGGGEGDEPSGGVRTDDEGRYELVLEGSGEYRFIVGDYGRQVSFTRTVSDQPEQRIDFEIPSARIVGRVSGPGGEVLDGVSVSLIAKEDEGRSRRWMGQRRTSSDEQGHFEFEDLDAGVTYVLRVGDDRVFGASTGDHARFARVVEIDDEAGVLEVDVALQRAGTLEGQVFDRAGQPVRRARIVVLDASGTRLSVVGSVRTRPDGRFVYPGVPPGEVTVFAELDAVESERQRLRVYEGAPAEVRLVFE